MDEKENNELVVKEAMIVQPAVSADVALEKFQAFQEIKNKCLIPADTLPINGQSYIRKTGWRKIKTIFNLTEEILESRREEFKVNDKDEFRWIYRVRARANNGAYADSEMCCSSIEDFAWQDRSKTKRKPETALMAMAQTRAFNRAISDLVGGGEVTAEEMMGIDQTEEQKKAVPISGGLVCANCKVQVTEKIADFSVRNYDMILCMKCQQEKKK